MYLFAGVAGVVLAVAVLYYYSANKIFEDGAQENSHVIQQLSYSYNLLQRISGDLAENNRFIQQFLKVSDPDEVEKAIQDRDKRQAEIAAMIDSKGSDTTAIKSAYDNLIKLEKAAIAELLRGNGALASEKNNQVVAPQGEVVLEEIRKFHTQVENHSKLLMAGQQSLIQRQILTRLVILLGALVVILTAGWRLKNHITVTLQRVAGDLSNISNTSLSSANQVSAASEVLAEGASAQAASIEQTSASLEQMSSMTKRNADNAQKANELAQQTRLAADKGINDMRSMSAAMSDIKHSSDDIAKIIRTIDEIAFQTNILALNAAVEAARAGEAGMGFAVVADEVRNLAQRSATAAKETAVKIEGAIGNTARGVDISQKVSIALNEIAEKVRQVDDLVAEVAGASKEQTQGIVQINGAVGQMDKVTQANAASAEESAAAAKELNQQARAMQSSVADLLQLVGNEATNTPAPPAPDWHQVNPTSPRQGPVKTVKTTPPTREESIPLESEFRDF